MKNMIINGKNLKFVGGIIDLYNCLIYFVMMCEKIFWSICSVFDICLSCCLVGILSIWCFWFCF